MLFADDSSSEFASAGSTNASLTGTVVPKALSPVTVPWTAIAAAWAGNPSCSARAMTEGAIRATARASARRAGSPVHPAHAGRTRTAAPTLRMALAFVAAVACTKVNEQPVAPALQLQHQCPAELPSFRNQSLDLLSSAAVAVAGLLFWRGRAATPAPQPASRRAQSGDAEP